MSRAEQLAHLRQRWQASQDRLAEMTDQARWRWSDHTVVSVQIAAEMINRQRISAQILALTEEK